MSGELLPCPFCGEEAEIITTKRNEYIVKCKKIGCCYGSPAEENPLAYTYEKDAIELWNTRTPPSGGESTPDVSDQKVNLTEFAKAVQYHSEDVSDITKENEVLREQNLALNKSNAELVEALGDITRSYHMQHAFDIARQAISNHAKGDV